MVYIDREENGDIYQTRSCTPEDPAPRMLCESHGEELDPNYSAHCCYKDMCNTVDKMNLTLPIVNPFTSHHTSKGNFIYLFAPNSWILNGTICCFKN